MHVGSAGPLAPTVFTMLRGMHRQTIEAWDSWTELIRMPLRAAACGRQTVEAGLQGMQPPPTTPEVDVAEARFREACGSGMALVGDDRDASKMWLVEACPMFLHLLSAILADPAWIRMPSISTDDVVRMMWAKCYLGLPAWLRRGATRCRPPSVFPLIKSKCWADSGIRLCVKAGHSCWRRVIGSGEQPWASGWRTMGRAARGVLRMAKEGFQRRFGSVKGKRARRHSPERAQWAYHTVLLQMWLLSRKQTHGRCL